MDFEKITYKANFKYFLLYSNILFILQCTGKPLDSLPPINTDANLNDINPLLCGNSRIDGEEQCDRLNLNKKTCSDFDFNGGTLGCNENCRFDFSKCNPCGNGKLDTGEECDKSMLNGKTCGDLGFESGTLRCNTSCAYDTHACQKSFSIQNTDGNQIFPAVASDGKNYLVAWHELRDPNNYDIYGMVIDASGKQLSQGAFPITNAPGNQSSIKIAFDGTNYLVVWADGRNTTSDIYGARVTSSGKVLDPQGIPIATGSGDKTTPRVSFDGNHFFVVWTYDRGDPLKSDIFGARVDKAGIVLDLKGIEIYSDTGIQLYPDIASNGSLSLVVFTDLKVEPDKIYGVRVDQAGKVLDDQPIQISNKENNVQSRPAINFGSKNFLVAWEQYIAPDNQGDQPKINIKAARITGEGGVLEPFGVRLNSGDIKSIYPRMAFNGTSFLVVWTDFRNQLDNDIYGALVKAEGQIKEKSDFPICTLKGAQNYPQAAGTGQSFLIAWTDKRNMSSDDIYGTFLLP